MKHSALALAVLFAAAPAHALVAQYYQCGGSAWTGETECESGLVCVVQNDFYYQCLVYQEGQTTAAPSGGVASSSASSSSSSSPTSSLSTSSSSTSSSSTTSSKPTTSSTSTTSSKSTTSSVSTTKSSTTSTSAVATASAQTGMVGYATLNGGTTGGAGGTTTTVGDLAALRAAVSGTAKKIVYINKMITGDANEVDVGSNTSILGVCGGGLTAGGFRVKDGSNVIFRNLILHHSLAPVDLISIQVSHNIWIDHNTVYSTKGSDKDQYDGGIDITHAGDYVTISWNYVHDHWKTSLVGHSDSNESEDKGKLHVSYHHNYYYNVGSRLPSLRFGTGHIWNNYADTVSESCINSRLGAQVLVENNVFVNAAKPLLTTSYGGYAVERGNDWGGATPELNPGTLTSAPYAYTLESTSTVKASVVAGAGACKITV